MSPQGSLNVCVLASIVHTSMQLIIIELHIIASRVPGVKGHKWSTKFADRRSYEVARKMPGELTTEKPAEEVPDGDKKETPAAKSVVGIIYPPPEVRSILQIASQVLGLGQHTGQWLGGGDTCNVLCRAKTTRMRTNAHVA